MNSHGKENHGINLLTLEGYWGPPFSRDLSGNSRDLSGKAVICRTPGKPNAILEGVWGPPFSRDLSGNSRDLSGKAVICRTIDATQCASGSGAAQGRLTNMPEHRG